MSMDQQTSLSISSGQGFEFEMQVAGLGARAFAFTIDWHIRLLLSLLWILLILLLQRLELVSTGDEGYYYLPAVILYLFYHPVLELFMQGNSPGKRYAKVRVVTLEGGIPGPGAIIIRNIMRLIDSSPALYLVGITACFVSPQQRRIGDVAAGTVLIYEPHDNTLIEDLDSFLNNKRFTLEQQSAVRTLLIRWDKLELPKRVALGQKLLDKLEVKFHKNPDQREDIRSYAIKETLENLIKAKT